MSAGDYHPPLTDTGYNPLIPAALASAWQPQDGWPFLIQTDGTKPVLWVNPAANASPSSVPSYPWWGVIPPAPPALPPNVQITTSAAASVMPDARDDRIVALEAEVKRLQRECKRLQRRLVRGVTA